MQPYLMFALLNALRVLMMTIQNVQPASILPNLSYCSWDSVFRRALLEPLKLMTNA